MHLRKLILAGGFACSLLSNPALALGLGEAQLNSKLNEPLKAEIKLLDTRGLSADQVLIALAAPADFERNGVERLYFYSEFEFEVLLDNPGGAIVKVSSRGPVREPFINFLVEARWPTGRLLREYTLLMDLPVFSETSASRSVVAATTQSSVAPASTARPADTVQPAAPAPVSRPVVEPTPQPAARRATAASSASGDNYRVDRNDTLWQIALEVRPDSSHSVHQTMLAIQRLNPDAFINGNINRLRSGQVLRVPSSDDIRSLSRGEAVNEVARQNQSWGDNTLGAPLSAARRDSAPASNNTGVTGSVRLATPGSGDSSVGQGSGDNTGRGRALEGELASSLEELDKAAAENQELTSRVRDLEEQIKTMERLVEVSNSQLRALQLGGAADGAEADQATAAAATDDSALSDGSALADDTATAPDVAAVAPAVSASSAVASSAASSSQRAVVTTTPPQKSLLDSLFDYIHWIGAGLLALILLLLLLWKRRQDQQAQEPEVVDDSSIFVLPADTSSEINDEQAAEEALAADADALDVPDSGFEAETNDVVSEADIYIAYGKFDQAEDMLLKGLERDPESTEIRLKLLEVYSQQENAEKFDLHYARLIALASPMVLARATELREQIPGVGDFDLSEVPDEADDAALTAENDTDSLFDELFIDDANDPQEKSLLADNQPLTSDDDLSFDFDAELEALSEESLTDDKDLQNAASRYDLSFDAPVAPLADSAPEENELTFDFDLDDDPLEGDKPGLAATAAPTESLSELDDFSFDFDDLKEEESTPALTDNALTDKDEDELFSEADLTLLDDVGPELDADKPVVAGLSTEDALDDFSPDAEFDANAFDLEALDREINELEKEAGGSLSLTGNEADTSLFDDADEEITLDAPAPQPDIVDEDDDELSLADEDLEALFKEMTPVADAPEEEEALFALDDELTEKSSLDDFNFEELEALSSSEPAVGSDDDFSFDELASEIESDSIVKPDAPLELDEPSPAFAETLAPASVDLSDDDLDAELDFLADADEVATKLDLARAYIDMGDPEGARDILAEVAQEGNEQQQAEASQLLDSIG